MSLVRAAWMEEGDLEYLTDFLRRLLPLLKEKSESCELLDEFRLRRALCLVCASNILEGTISRGHSERETYALLERLWRGEQRCARECACAWRADGMTVSDDDLSSQLRSHLEAYRFLCEADEHGKYLYERPLSVETVLHTHGLLMRHAVDREGRPVCAGAFRVAAVHSEEITYPQPESVPAAVQAAVQRFNAAVAAKRDAVGIAVDLFCDLLSARPFDCGNGRLCCLMAAFAFFATGTPFAVCITSGYEDARRHYLHAILSAQRDNDRSQLYTLFAQSLEFCWTNMYNYCGLSL